MNNIRVRAGIATVIVWGIITATGCSDNGRSVTTSQGVAKAFGFGEDDGWVVLTRPTSQWILGSIIEFDADGRPRNTGTISGLACVPSDYWVTDSTKAPASATARKLIYPLSLAATLSVRDAELVKAGLSIDADGDAIEPNHKTSFKVSEAAKRSVDPTRMQAWLAANLQDLSDDCKRLLTDGHRYLIDEVYQIDRGALEVAARTGAQIDLTLPRFQAITTAADSAGFQVDKTGRLTITRPITFAVRTVDFTALRKQLGIPAPSPEPTDFGEAMQVAGAALPY